MTATENTKPADQIENLIEIAKKQKANIAVKTLKPVGLFGSLLSNKSAAIRFAEEKVATLRRQAAKAEAKEFAKPTGTNAFDSWVAAAGITL